jgi:hypothetical protein
MAFQVGNTSPPEINHLQQLLPEVHRPTEMAEPGDRLLIGADFATA